MIAKLLLSPTDNKNNNNDNNNDDDNKNQLHELSFDASLDPSVGQFADDKAWEHQVTLTKSRARRPSATSVHGNRIRYEHHRTDVENWDQAHVADWLRIAGFAEYQKHFAESEVDGKRLLLLEKEHLRDMGIVPLGDRLKILEGISGFRQESIKPNTSTLTKPNRFIAFLGLFTFNFAGTSEGKSGSDQKAEIRDANLAIAIVGALLTEQSFRWVAWSAYSCFCQGDECFCSGGFDLGDDELGLFHVLAGLSAACFLSATVFAIIQVIGINEMSDDDEVEYFMDYLGSHESLPGRLVSLGLLPAFGAMVVYMLFNAYLGILEHPENILTWATLVSFVFACLWTFVIAVSHLIQSVYVAKINSMKSVPQTMPLPVRSDTVADHDRELQQMPRKGVEHASVTSLDISNTAVPEPDELKRHKRNSERKADSSTITKKHHSVKNGEKKRHDNGDYSEESSKRHADSSKRRSDNSKRHSDNSKRHSDSSKRSSKRKGHEEPKFDPYQPRDNAERKEKRSSKRKGEKDSSRRSERGAEEDNKSSRHNKHESKRRTHHADK